MDAAGFAGTIESIRVQAYHRRTERSNASGEVARRDRIAIGFAYGGMRAHRMERNDKQIRGLMLRAVRASTGALARLRLSIGLLSITIGAALPVYNSLITGILRRMPGGIFSMRIRIRFPACTKPWPCNW